MSAELLRQAIEQLAAGERGFYEPLREAWRACRCAELAALVERAGRLVPWSHSQKSLKAWQAAWVARARERDPLELGSLFVRLAEQVEQPRAALIAACLDEVAPCCADDPQVTRPLLALVDQPFETPGWKRVLTRVYRGLADADDPRAIAGLGAAVERAERARAELSDDPTLKRPRNTRGRLEGRYPDGVPPLPAELAPLVAALSARLAAPSIAPRKPRVVGQSESLLDGVLADPFDDARRLVCADALQAVGDPRGELIVAQLSDTPEAAKRATAIIAKHRRALLGPIAKAVVTSSVVFEKGFLARCSAGVSRRVEIDQIFERPEWATVTHLTCSTAYAKLAPTMRSLVEVTNLPDFGLACLATATFPRLELLGVSGAEKDGMLAGKPTSASLRALASATGLPKLRELRLGLSPIEWRYDNSIRPDRYERDAADYAWLLAAPFAAQLETIHVRYHLSSSLASWLGTLRTRPSLKRIVARGPVFDVAMTATSGELQLRAGTPHHDFAAARAEIRAALFGAALTET